MYHNFFIHSTVDRHLGCFHVLAIVNGAALKTEVRASFSVMVFSECMPRSRIVGSYNSFIPRTEKETQMYRTDFWTVWEKARVGCFKRTASKHVYYLGWNRSPAHAGCMRQVLGPGALGSASGIGWSGRWEGGSGWGIHVYPRLIHVNVWQKPLQYCKVISLQLIKKIN